MNRRRLSDDEARRYQRDAAAVTDLIVLPVGDGRRRWRGKRAQRGKPQSNRQAEAEAEEILDSYDGAVQALAASLAHLGALRRPRLIGKVEDEQAFVRKAAAHLGEARKALASGDLGGAGKGLHNAVRQMSSVGNSLMVVLSAELAQQVLSRESKAALLANKEQRRRADAAAELAGAATPRGALLARVPTYELIAEGLDIAAEILAAQPSPSSESRRAFGPSDDGLRVVAPDELETFADVGGLDDAKERLRRAVRLAIEGSAGANRSHVANGILLYGPPGTGKTLLARAVAGEYGLRFLRFSPAAIASTYQHEPAKKLRQVFDKAAQSSPCLLLLDEFDAIAHYRQTATSSDQREVVTQLLNSLEEFREAPGLLIMAATNMLDDLDPALREGRFDTRIAIPMPTLDARREILKVQLEKHGGSVAWDGLNLDDVAHQTAGRSGASLAAIVVGAAGRALARRGALAHDDLLAEIDSRSGQDRSHTVEDKVGWEDVVLPEPTRQRLAEILLVFQRPEFGRRLGVLPPAGILLHGPPGTGKTTIAKAMATEVKASLYEHSAASLLSKWVGESEQTVARLFSRARDNRPSIIFCDEIETILKRRASNSSAPWEERVVSQFLRELDGLHSGEGVLLVGATNRPDMIDEAVQDRRLVPVEVPLPDAAGRAKLLRVLCRGVQLGSDVDLAEVVEMTHAMSGADLKALRNSAGMKALARAARTEGTSNVAIFRRDFAAALGERGILLPPKRGRRRSPNQK